MKIHYGHETKIIEFEEENLLVFSSMLLHE